MTMMEITKDTKLSELLAEYPRLKERIVEINEKFKMLDTPVGKVMLGRATIGDMSKKSGMDVDAIIGKIKELIFSH